MAVLTPGPSVFVEAVRVAELDENGFAGAGATTITTKDTVKLSSSPVIETGDDIVQKGASGDIVVAAKHGDMSKYATIALDLALPDPALQALCCGGIMVGSATAALGAPTGLTVVGQITLGTLATGTYGYRASQYNVFGESIPEADVSTTVASGETGAVVVSGVKPAAGAVGIKIYGRTIGQERYLGEIEIIGKQTMSGNIAAKAAKAGVPMNLAVTALTKSVPAGTEFQITGDPNTPKITFTVTAQAAVGATTLRAEPNAENAAEIKTAEIIPVFMDTGALVPSQLLPQSDTTAGPGENVGYQDPPLLKAASPFGVSIEVFTYVYINAAPPATQPKFWWAFPRVRFMHVLPRDLTNANAATIMEGQAIENPNWGAGPSGAFPNDTTKWRQFTRCGEQVVPKASYTPTLAVA